MPTFIIALSTKGLYDGNDTFTSFDTFIAP